MAVRALKEREEERADMTVHLHDGVLQTLALIQLHADDEQQVFMLARSAGTRVAQLAVPGTDHERSRSVSAGLQEIAAQVEDTHGKPIEVVTAGDARPSAQTDALLDAARQAMVNAVTHGGEPVSRVLRGGSASGGGVCARPRQRVRHRRHSARTARHTESIIGARAPARRHGGDCVVDPPGTEVRMHMPLEAGFDSSRTSDSPTDRPAQSGDPIRPAQSTQSTQST